MFPHVMLSPRWVRRSKLTRVGVVGFNSWNAGTFDGRVWCFTGEARTVRWCCHAAGMLHGNPRQLNG